MAKASITRAAAEITRFDSTRWIRDIDVPTSVLITLRDRVFSAHPVVEGQSSCPDQQVIAAATQDRADPAQPDYARLVGLLPTRSGQTHHEFPGKLRVAQGDSVDAETAPLELT